MSPREKDPARGKPVRQRWKVSYQWRLREVMAEHKMYATTELVPLLAERGITLSASQVHRLVTQTPERLSLPVLAALCDIFTIEPGDLVPTDATSIGVRAAAAGDRPAPHSLTPPQDLRPVRVHVSPPPQ